MLDLREGCNCVGNDHRVAVSEKIVKLMKEAPIPDQLCINIKKLGNTYGSCFPYIGVFILSIIVSE